MEKVIKASLDRFEGDWAVVYADDDGRKFDVPSSMVKGANAGSKLRLHIEDNEVRSIDIDSKSTNEAKDRIRRKYERLRKRGHAPKRERI